MEQPIIGELRAMLLSMLNQTADAKPKKGESSKPFFEKLVDKIQKVTGCDACSLWRINTLEDVTGTKRIKFVSLESRSLKPGLTDKHGNPADQ